MKLTLKDAFKAARKAQKLEYEPFYVLQHRESGEYAICRHRFLHMWHDKFKVVLEERQ